MTVRVAVDLNVRVRGNQTFSGFSDADGMLAPGDAVEVYERETGVSGPGCVTDIDAGNRLIYLLADWQALREPVTAEQRQSA
jgi:hypothetical protein